jgi:hypothetical protein
MGHNVATFILCAAWLVLAFAFRGEAAEWSVLPSIGANGVYNSNLILTPFPHSETYGYWISPAAEFAGKTERLEVSGRTAADFVSYYGGQNTSFYNLYLPLTTRYKTETDQLDFTGGFVRDNTLMGELLNTGVVLRFTQRNQWTANPSWTRALTEKLSFQSSFQLSDTTYENGLSLGLVNYQLFGGSGGLLYQLTEKDQVQLSGSYVNFHTTNSPASFRSGFPGASLNLTHMFSESLIGTLYGGPRFVNTTSQIGAVQIKTNDTVWVFGGNLTKKFERSTIQATVSRDIIPSGFGLLIQTDRVAATVTHNLSETIALSLDASAYRVSGVTTTALGTSLADQKYFYVTPTISWKFLEWWKAELSYAYRLREVTGVPDATSNGTMFTLTYFPPKLARSN